MRRLRGAVAQPAVLSIEYPGFVRFCQPLPVVQGLGLSIAASQEVAKVSDYWSTHTCALSHLVTGTNGSLSHSPASSDQHAVLPQEPKLPWPQVLGSQR